MLSCRQGVICEFGSGWSLSALTSVRKLLPDLYGQCAANAPELLETALDALWAFAVTIHDQPIRTRNTRNVSSPTSLPTSVICPTSPFPLGLSPVSMPGCPSPRTTRTSQLRCSRYGRCSQRTGTTPCRKASAASASGLSSSRPGGHSRCVMRSARCCIVMLAGSTCAGPARLSTYSARPCVRRAADSVIPSPSRTSWLGRTTTSPLSRCLPRLRSPLAVRSSVGVFAIRSPGRRNTRCRFRSATPHLPC